jgi:hypothetical protein
LSAKPPLQVVLQTELQQPKGPYRSKRAFFSAKGSSMRGPIAVNRDSPTDHGPCRRRSLSPGRPRLLPPSDCQKENPQLFRIAEGNRANLSWLLPSSSCRMTSDHRPRKNLMAFSQVGHHCKTSAELLRQRQGVAACSRSCPFHGEVMCPGGSSKRWAVASVGEAPHIVCEPNLDVLACGGAAIESIAHKKARPKPSRSIGERRGPTD